MNIKNIAMFAFGVALVVAVIYRVQVVRSVVIGA
jgi:hypothetical protein